MENKNGINFLKKFVIPSKIKSYKIEKEICQISSAHLCLATNINIKEKVLIKIYDKEIIQHNFDEISLINNDIFMMRLINHKNILKLYEIIESPSYIFLVMENFNPIKLIDYLKSKKKLSEDDSLKIYTQIISVLLYFNEMNIGHLNINPDDILIDNSHNIKICDFKYSVFYSSNEEVKCKYIGNRDYLSPELISEKKCYPELADIWSSGVLLYLCIVGQLPFKGINDLDLQKKIMSGEFSLPLSISKNLQELFKNIFEAKADLRYNLEQIINSSLFKEKKIKKHNLAKGFNVLSTKYPIDERVINICNTYFGIEPEDIKQKLFKNIFDPQTSLYKQIITKLIKKKISTEIDLTSKKFNNYIENKKNILDDSIQKNNIQENLEKLDEIKAKNIEIQTTIEEKEKKTLIDLDELNERYQNYLDDEKEKEKENAEKLEKNKNDELNNKDNNIRKRNSVNIISKKNFLKFNTYENQLNYGRRMSSNVHIGHSIKESLEKLINKEKELKDLSSKDVEKYIQNKTDIIQESKEEEEKKEPSPSLSKSSSLNSSVNKTQSKILNNNISKDNENIKNKIDSNDKGKKHVKINVDKNKNNNLQKDKNNKTTKAPPKETKEEFISQIKNVKLKKYTPNTYTNPDEIKKKQKEENKNQSAIEYTNLSVKNVLEMVEENLKNAKKNKNNLTAQKRKERTNINKKNRINKYNKYNSTNIYSSKAYRKRKSIKNKDLYMFHKKGMLVNKKDIPKEKSKDDVSRFKFRVKKYNEEDIIQEKDLQEFVIPKDYNTEKKIKEEKRKKFEEKRRKKGKEERELEEKKKKELEKKRQKEIEEQKRKEEEELRLKLLEEERIRKEKEEEERRIKEKEEEEERQRLLEIEKKRIMEEERERKLKEMEEEEKRKLEEELIRREKEKEKMRLEEEEKIRKWKEEAKRQKELEEKKKREEEEKERREEEERIRKRLEESEKKRREMQEESRRRFEEYEKMRKDEEDKRILREQIRKKKDEEIRLQREKQLKEKRERESNSERKKTVIKLQFENDNESSEEEEEEEDEEEKKPIKKEIIENKNNDKNNSSPNKKNINKYTLSSNPFDLYKDEYSDESITPKAVQKKKSIKPRVSVHGAKKKRKTGPKLIDLNKFRESELYPSESESESSEENIISKNENKNEGKINTISGNTKNMLYNKFTDYFFDTSILNSEINTSKENNVEEKIVKKEEIKKPKLFYHYQKNIGRRESKNIYLKNLQNRNKNKRITSIEKRTNISYINKNNNNKNNISLTNNKNIIPTYNIRTIRIRKPKNVEKDYNIETNKTSITTLKSKNNVSKNKTNKRILKTKTELTKIKVVPKKVTDSYNTKIQNLKKRMNNISNLKRKINKKPIYDTFDNNDNNLDPLISNSTILTKRKKLNYPQFIPDFDINSSNKSNRTLIKIKSKSKMNLKESELPLYKGDINYDNVSAKSIEETIKSLRNKYKLKGYTCLKKDKNKFKFVKGPNIHIAELMRLGNGLLYCNITKI